jgi:lipoate-protein ligase A
VTNPAPAKDKTKAAVFERLEVIDDPEPRSASFNMAADESLLDQIGDTAVLRIYRWVRPAISFGYFTRFEEVRRPLGERELVRRWTGGGIVEHGRDFTYSLVVPKRQLEGLGPPVGTYELIHHALARALVRAGVAADVIGEAHARKPAGARDTPGSACFENPVPHDVMIEGRKAAGAAQRRTRRGLLHQGSVQGLEQGRGGAMADWRARLAVSLPEALCSSSAPREFTPAEAAASSRLAETKYASEAWLRRC